MEETPSDEGVQKLYERLKSTTESGGYHLNPDPDITMPLVEGLATNTERYGYPLCPCRLTGGSREEDLDIICPCDYRDPDLDEYDTCYCCLYVTEKVTRGEKKVGSIPERRPSQEERGRSVETSREEGGIRVWRCRVCGYLCARENPPEVCPVCKASKDRFEIFDFP